MTDRFEITNDAAKQENSPTPEAITWYVMEGNFEHCSCLSEDAARRTAKALKDKADLKTHTDTKLEADYKYYKYKEKLIIAKSKIAIETLDQYIKKSTPKTLSTVDLQNKSDISVIKEQKTHKPKTPKRTK